MTLSCNYVFQGSHLVSPEGNMYLLSFQLLLNHYLKL